MIHCILETFLGKKQWQKTHIANYSRISFRLGMLYIARSSIYPNIFKILYYFLFDWCNYNKINNFIKST